MNGRPVYLAAIVQSSDDAIVSKTLDGIVTSWNRAAERIFGYSAEEMIGRPVAILAAPARANEMPGILDRLRRGEHIEPTRPSGGAGTAESSMSADGVPGLRRSRADRGRLEDCSRRHRGQARTCGTPRTRGATALDPRHGSGWHGRHRRARHRPILERDRGTHVRLPATEVRGRNVSILMPSPHRKVMTIISPVICGPESGISSASAEWWPPNARTGRPSRWSFRWERSAAKGVACLPASRAI